MSVRIIISLLLITISFSCTNRISGQNVSISQMNIGGVFYKSIPYEIELNTNNEKIFFSVRNAQVTNMGINKFRINFLDSSKYGLVTFFAFENNQKKVLSKFGGKLRPLPITIFTQYKPSGDTIDIKKIENTRVVADVQNLGLNLMFPIQSFSVEGIVNNKTIKISSNKNTFSKEQIDMLKMLDDGQSIIINDIIIKQFNKQRIIREPVVYYISK